jgi:hypothetical protein
MIVKQRRTCRSVWKSPYRRIWGYADMWLWAGAGLILIVVIATIPATLRWGRRNAKGNAAGFMLSIGAMFANLFDPAKAQATEELDRTKRTGGTKQQEASDQKKPPLIRGSAIGLSTRFLPAQTVRGHGHHALGKAIQVDQAWLLTPRS